MTAPKASDLNPSLFSPRTKKVAAKKTVQTVATRAVAKQGGKVLAKGAAKAGLKAGGKSVLRGMANPWLLAADGVDFGVRTVAERFDVGEDDAKAAGKVSGLGASIGIGAAFGGPAGAVGGAILWGIGEGISCLFGWND
jgi:hypothetical protein